jgi:DNA-binding NarL/FixJ family response regulator
MIEMNKTINLASALEHNIPYLRRYSRALTGNQTSGDSYAVAALEALSADRSLFDASLEPRVALFKVLHGVWAAADPLTRGIDGDEAGSTLELKAHERLAHLTPNSREAVLLKMLEGFQIPEIAEILELSEEEAFEMVETGLSEMRSSVISKVLIIEDEPIIAMDIESIISEMGHDVVGVARTEAEAEHLAKDAEFDIVLADINLADGSSGIDAVKSIFGTKGELPVIFITAYPERLLTGERPEPTFLITKPFDEEQVRSSVSQALFFATTEVLKPHAA